MTLGELRETIAHIPASEDGRLVILQADSEGNGYRLCADLDPKCAYQAESGWHGEVFGQDGTGEDAPPEDAVPCVVLFPVN